MLGYRFRGCAKLDGSRTAESCNLNLHIDGCESTVGDCTADSTCQSESGVEGNAAELLGGFGGEILDDGIDLRRASGGCG
jgi:hypothetical protein